MKTSWSLFRIEEFVKNPTFSIIATPKPIKQSNDIFVRAMREELGPGLKKSELQHHSSILWIGLCLALL